MVVKPKTFWNFHGENRGGLKNGYRYYVTDIAKVNPVTYEPDENGINVYRIIDSASVMNPDNTQEEFITEDDLCDFEYVAYYDKELEALDSEALDDCFKWSPITVHENYLWSELSDFCMARHRNITCVYRATRAVMTWFGVRARGIDWLRTNDEPEEVFYARNTLLTEAEDAEGWHKFVSEFEEVDFSEIRSYCPDLEEVRRNGNSLYYKTNRDKVSRRTVAATAILAYKMLCPIMDITPELKQSLLDCDFDSFKRAFEAIKTNQGRKCEIVSAVKFLRNKQERIDRQNVDRIKNQILTIENQLSGLYVQKHELECRAFWGREHDNTEELMSFLLNCQGIEGLQVKESYGNTVLEFGYKTPLLYWADEEWSMFRKSDDIFKNKYPWTQKLLSDIFERRITVFVSSRVKICIDSNGVDIDNAGGVCTDSVPNPHIYDYNCWDANKGAARRYILDGDYVSAFAQIFSTIAGIEITDTAVMHRFMAYVESGFCAAKQWGLCLQDNETGEVLLIEEYKERMEMDNEAI